MKPKAMLPIKRVIILACVVFATILIVALPSPLRAYAPQWFGLHCDDRRVRTDEPSRSHVARRLVEEAENGLPPLLGAIDVQPTKIFCSQQSCFEAFGTRRSAAGSILAGCGKTLVFSVPSG